MLRSWIAVFIVFGAMAPALGMPPSWNSLSSRNFIVYYRKAEPQEINKIIKTCESYYKSIPQSLGLELFIQPPGDKLFKIYIYDTSEEYQSQTGEPEWSDGSSIQRLRVIFSFKQANDFMDRVLPHELAHIIFREAVGFDNDSVPVWLEEGVASFSEDRDLERIESALRIALNKGLLPGLESLGTMNPRSLEDKGQIDLFYGQALSVVNYLISRKGAKRFGLFCRNLRQGKDLESSLLRAFRYKNIRELNKSWQEHIYHGR